MEASEVCAVHRSMDGRHLWSRKILEGNWQLQKQQNID